MSPNVPTAAGPAQLEQAWYRLMRSLAFSNPSRARTVQRLLRAQRALTRR